MFVTRVAKVGMQTLVLLCLLGAVSSLESTACSERLDFSIMDGLPVMLGGKAHLEPL
jgi:hypothetical protein